MIKKQRLIAFSVLTCLKKKTRQRQRRRKDKSYLSPTPLPSARLLTQRFQHLTAKEGQGQDAGMCWNKGTSCCRNHTPCCGLGTCFKTTPHLEMAICQSRATPKTKTVVQKTRLFSSTYCKMSPPFQTAKLVSQTTSFTAHGLNAPLRESSAVAKVSYQRGDQISLSLSS